MSKEQRRKRTCASGRGIPGYPGTVHESISPKESALPCGRQPDGTRRRREERFVSNVSIVPKKLSNFHFQYDKVLAQLLKQGFFLHTLIYTSASQRRMRCRAGYPKKAVLPGFTAKSRVGPARIRLCLEDEKAGLGGGRLSRPPPGQETSQDIKLKEHHSITRQSIAMNYA